MHTPLMLQTVLGWMRVVLLTPSLFPPKTMGQRLFRAKTKIRDGGIQLNSARARLPERLDAVLKLSTLPSESAVGRHVCIDPRGRDLAEEAIWLAGSLQLMPSEAEFKPAGSHAAQESRRSARRHLMAGTFLFRADPKQWSLL